MKKYSGLFTTIMILSALMLASCSNTTSANNTNEQVDNAKESVTVASDNSSTVANEVDTMDEISANDQIPSLRDCVPETLDGAYIGCAVTYSEINDPKVFDIVTQHFNAVTLGNELKMDCLFGYSNSVCPGTQEAELNGETIIVPTLTYKRAEAILDKLYDWNEANPDRKIMVRGHVLLWHSQAPEWFFHVDYDKNKDYVDKDTMNKRLEWYIKTVLTHFTGEDSKYKDMFYGWDVVNEAVSDSGSGIRNDNENPNESLSNDTHGSNSSWYHIYQNEEFIINAFIYANKYAPADLELYYNDYNECNTLKRNAICELLTKIKEKEGEPGVGTRISAMGMQGHYAINDPDMDTIAYSIKEYAKIVGAVQFTELDITSSDTYDGSEESKVEENEKLRKRYNLIYYAIKSTNELPDAEVGGITFWGTVDKYSWLQFRSDVGGGNTTGKKHMPLLFDDNYEPKPAFYVFADKAQ